MNPEEDVLGLVKTTVHGRYLAALPTRDGPSPLLVGFHGYAENATTQLQRLRATAGSEGWLKVAVQALYRFYGKDRAVVASWMTSEDRDRAISDNLAYVNATVEHVTERWPTTDTVFAGFSQGVAMAFRAAVHQRRGAHVFAMAGDVPPELSNEALSTLAGVVMCRGTSDELYTGQQWERDLARLRAAGVSFSSVECQGGHEWNAETGAALGKLLASFTRL